MTKKPTISLIVAITKNNVIGDKGGMPWHIPSDLRRFKNLTMNKPMIMGSRTYKSLKKPLPGRDHIILTHKNYDKLPERLFVVHNVEDAISLAEAKATDEIFVIGGAIVYNEFFDFASRVYLTLIDEEIEGDTKIEFDFSDDWEIIEECENPPDEKDSAKTRFIKYERIKR